MDEPNPEIPDPAPTKWRAGEARPAGALPGSLGEETGAALACMALILSALALLPDGTTAETVVAAAGLFALPAASGASASLAVDRPGRVGVARAFRRALGEQAKATAGFACAGAMLCASAADRIARTFGAGRGTDTLETPFGFQQVPCSGAARPFAAFIRIASKAAASGERLVDACRRPGEASERGSWMLACSAARNSDWARAARIWMEKPFNPDWTVRFEGAPLPFREAMERIASRGSEEAAICSLVAAESERAAIHRSADEPAKPKPGAPRPAGAARGL